jgi:extradiol dioxygenase family protein
MLTPFHIALRVHDIDVARNFYGELMGFEEGRSSDQWIDFDMFGHQFVVHLDSAMEPVADTQQVHNQVDGRDVPVPHCGVVLGIEDWEVLARRVASFIQDFVVDPHVRFAGQPGEQCTMFFRDPSGNALEFKAFKDIDRELFQTEA